MESGDKDIKVQIIKMEEGAFVYWQPNCYFEMHFWFSFSYSSKLYDIIYIGIYF